MSEKGIWYLWKIHLTAKPNDKVEKQWEKVRMWQDIGKTKAKRLEATLVLINTNILINKNLYAYLLPHSWVFWNSCSSNWSVRKKKSR